MSGSTETHWPFPLRIDGRGRTAAADEDTHVRQLIEQLLFTSPGERVNRPDFGTGLTQLIFAPNSPELATSVQFTVQGALQQFLGDRIKVEDVQAESEDATVTITVRYVVLQTQERRVAEFTSEI